MTMKQIGQVTALLGGLGTAGSVTYGVAKSRFIPRDEYEAEAKKRASDETARAIQLAGWQQTLNTVVDSQREAAETQKDIAKKLDEFILETLRERRGRR